MLVRNNYPMNVIKKVILTNFHPGKEKIYIEKKKFFSFPFIGIQNNSLKKILQTLNEQCLITAKKLQRTP